MRILVTGCAGFIGSHLCERLLEAGHTITGVDALTDYYDPDLKLRNLERCLDDSRFEFFHAPINAIDKSKFGEAAYVFHLAAQPGVSPSWGSDFSTYLLQNVLDTQWLLETLRGSRAKLLYASSSSVYGNTDVERVCEQHPTAPYSPYGVSKLAAEHLCSAYAANFGTHAISLRLFTVYGPRQRPDMLFANLVLAALTGKRFPLYGDGTIERDFTSVFDVVDGFMLAASAETKRGVFNIAGGRVISVNEAIAAVEDIAGVKVKVDRRPGRSGDVRRTGADISAARAKLGYVPRRNLRETLEAQIQATEEQLKASRRATPVCA